VPENTPNLPKSRQRETRIAPPIWRRLSCRHAVHIKIRLRVPSWRPARFFDFGAEDDGVVEGNVVGPDELGAFEVVVELGLLGVDLFDAVFFGVLPTDVVELGGPPVGGEWFFDDFGIGGVAVDGAVEEVFGLPGRIDLTDPPLE
jgi:hypothetical protein